jgi:hypothetical protein
LSVCWGRIMHKNFCLNKKKKWHSPRKVGSSSPLKWNQRGSFLRTKIKYTDSLYQIRIDTSSFSFFNVKIWIFFLKKEKKISWIYTRKKKSKKSSQFLCQKMAKFGPKKKDTGKDLEWSFMGIQVQSSAVHY